METKAQHDSWGFGVLDNEERLRGGSSALEILLGLRFKWVGRQRKDFNTISHVILNNKTCLKHA